MIAGVFIELDISIPFTDKKVQVAVIVNIGKFRHGK